MRANKSIIPVGFREKACNIYFICPHHRGLRLVKVKKGWICPDGCGIISTIDPSVLGAQELKRKDVT